MARPKKANSIHLAGRVLDVEFVKQKLALGLSQTDIVRQAISIWRNMEAGGEYPQNIKPLTGSIPKMESKSTLNPVLTDQNKDHARKKEPKTESQPLIETNLEQDELDSVFQALNRNFFS